MPQALRIRTHCSQSRFVGLKDDALRDAKKLLVKKGYLEDLGEDNYIFHQVPEATEKEEKKKEEHHPTLADIRNPSYWEF